MGEKTAAALVSEHGSLAAIRASAEDEGSSMAASVRRKLLDAADYLDVAPAVVGVVRDISLPEVDARIVAAPADPERFEELTRRWGLGSSAVRAASALSAVSA